MKVYISKVAAASLLLPLALICAPAQAQQFNSDSWLSKPHGTVTVIPTFGEQYNMLMTTFSLFPKTLFSHFFPRFRIFPVTKMSQQGMPYLF